MFETKFPNFLWYRFEFRNPIKSMFNLAFSNQIPVKDIQKLAEICLYDFPFFPAWTQFFFKQG